MPANPEEAYLVRGADGRMSTIMAFSLDGAKRDYLRRKRPKRGSSFSIKLRNGPTWTHFVVS